MTMLISGVARNLHMGVLNYACKYLATPLNSMESPKFTVLVCQSTTHSAITQMFASGTNWMFLTKR